eukprot:scaffold190908_cov67-Attheya_sp.AAC.5
MLKPGGILQHRQETQMENLSKTLPSWEKQKWGKVNPTTLLFRIPGETIYTRYFEIFKAVGRIIGDMLYHAIP